MFWAVRTCLDKKKEFRKMVQLSSRTRLLLSAQEELWTDIICNETACSLGGMIKGGAEEPEDPRDCRSGLI